MANEYIITTLTDFLNVPEDRLASCLADFPEFLKMLRMKSQIEKSSEDYFAIPAGSVQLAEHFHWVDDGKGGMSGMDFYDKGGNPLGSMGRK